MTSVSAMSIPQPQLHADTAFASILTGAPTNTPMPLMS